MREHAIPCMNATQYEIERKIHMTWNDDRLCDSCLRHMDRFALSRQAAEDSETDEAEAPGIQVTLHFMETYPRTFTVEQLMEALSKLPQDAPVYIGSSGGDYPFDGIDYVGESLAADDGHSLVPVSEDEFAGYDPDELDGLIPAVFIYP